MLNNIVFFMDHFFFEMCCYFRILSNYGYPCVFGACRTATKSCIDNECSFVSQSQQSAAVSARSSTERQQQSQQQQLALSKVQQSWAEGEFPATIMSELPSGKSGGIGRERTLNGESTHQTPLPIHLAIESEDHSTDKKKRTLDTVQESTHSRLLRKESTLNLFSVICSERHATFYQVLENQ